MLIRTVKPSDATDISLLMEQLGYRASADLIRRKVSCFAESGVDAVFVAELNTSVVGAISCHITSLFHQAGASGRITSLVVDQYHRKLGIGNALVARAEEFFIARGCVKFEVTSGDHRSAAHAFYESCGYLPDERRFLKRPNPGER